MLKKNILDIVAVIVACVAVYISVVQGGTQKEIERVSKQPLLQIELTQANYEPLKGFRLSNLGFGPAIIKSFRFYLNEDEYLNHPDRHHEAWLPTLTDSLGYIFERINFLTTAYAIGEKDSNKDIYLLGTTATQFSFGETEFPLNFFDSRTKHMLSNIIIEIEYTSMNPLDNYVYYLRYGENQKPSNYREQRTKAKW